METLYIKYTKNFNDQIFIQIIEHSIKDIKSLNDRKTKNIISREDYDSYRTQCWSKFHTKLRQSNFDTYQLQYVNSVVEEILDRYSNLSKVEQKIFQIKMTQFENDFNKYPNSMKIK